jgi:hypothetical protein
MAGYFGANLVFIILGLVKENLNSNLYQVLSLIPNPSLEKKFPIMMSQKLS